MDVTGQKICQVCDCVAEMSITYFSILKCTQEAFKKHFRLAFSVDSKGKGWSSQQYHLF